MSDSPPPFDRKGGINISGGTISVAGDLIAGDVNYHITNNFFADPAQARNRRDMLELVKNIWVKGVLEKSLYHEVLIDLGLQEQPSAVEHPWDIQLQMPDRTDRTLPPGMPFVQVFDEMNGALLILGEPGSGKTTMLLQLARDLITRAEQDPLMRIPVVFNLSSWSYPKQSIADWLIVELSTKYYVSKKLARAWVEQDALLLLLDGLDEVKVEQRKECVQALNTFRSENGMMPLVVCSRVMSYQSLTVRLNLRGAVLIQPLSSAQIDYYLENAGTELGAIRHVLSEDFVLRDLAKHPLFLSIITRAYSTMPATVLLGERFRTYKSRRDHLFNTYIQQMFHRVGRSKSELYTPAKTIHWLTWLAQQMIRNGEAIFFLKSLRRDWLPTPSSERSFRTIARSLFVLCYCLFFGLYSSLLAALFVGPDLLSDLLILGLIYGALAGLLVGTLFVRVPEGAMNSHGRDTINYYALRFALYYENCMPLRSSRFLNYAAEHIFLRKVGGGYIFIHRTLMEHFAALKDNPPRP